VTSRILHGSILQSVLFNIVISGLQEMKECVCRCYKIVGDQSICLRAGLLYRWTRHRLEKCVNLMKISKGK